MPTSTRTDLERLTLFVDRVQRLVDRRGLRDGTIASRFNMKASTESTTFRFDIGDEDDLIAVMAAFRQFTAPREDTHLPKICNLLEQVLTDPQLRDANRANRDAWRLAETGGILLQIPGRDLHERDCYDLWTNAEVFHADQADEALYRRLPDHATGIIRTRASSFVITGARILHLQRNVASAHLRSVGR